MRILHLDTERTWRGGEAQLIHLSRSLAQRGHQSIVVGPPGSPLLNRAAELGMEAEAVPMPSEWNLAAIRTLTRILKRGRIQILHMHSSHACSLGGWAARLARVPVRIISRRVDFSVRSNPLRKMKYEWGVDRIVAISEGVRKVLVQDGLDPEKIEVIRSGIEPSRFDPNYPPTEARREFAIPDNAPVVGCVAHFADHKGHRYLIEAAARVVRSEPAVRFLLVGDGELKSDIERQINSLNMDRSVILTGFRSDIPRILAAMDIVTLASHKEGLGTSLLDAMAMARPVVATRVGGIPEMIQDGLNGILVSPKDPERLAEALIRLIRDEPARRRMGEAGRARVQSEFSAEAMARATEALYRRVMESKGDIG